LNADRQCRSRHLNSENIRIVAFAGDPLEVLGQCIFDDHSSSLPDLSHVTIVVPRLEAAPRVRAVLLQSAADRGCDALLGPRVVTLQAWAAQFSPAPLQVVSEHARELLLVEALSGHEQLFGGSSPWVISEHLLQLFDELVLNRSAWPDSGAAFATRLAQAYGVTQPTRGLSQEATIVYTLWQAYQRQLTAERQWDGAMGYHHSLGRCAEALSANDSVYAVGFVDLSAAEIDCSRQLLRNSNFTLILHGQRGGEETVSAYHPDGPVENLCRQLDSSAIQPQNDQDAYNRFLNMVFSPGAGMTGERGADASMLTRARQFALRQPSSPTDRRLFFYQAPDFENEARGVDIQVRRWLLAGHKKIAIVTEDRRLARRVRALLERAGILIHDSGGWVLSTTQAAAAVERWLESVEQSFVHDALLDLLKSPFVLPHWDYEQRMRAVYRFEQDIVRNRNVGLGFDRYRHHVEQKTAAEPEWPGDAVLKMLDEVYAAATPLLKQRLAQDCRPQDFIDALVLSMERLGLWQQFRDDEAGARLLCELQYMRRATHGRRLHFTWHECRLWLGRVLERVRFQTPVSHPNVELLTLEQTALMRFDAVVLAAADCQHLSADHGPRPFFNEEVRRSFALPTRRDQLRVRFYHFRRLLESAPLVCLTARRDDDSGESTTSPWVELIDTFHDMAYGRRLEDNDLGAHVHHPAAQVVNESFGTQARPVARPAPKVAEEMLPIAVSASSYQRLLDCPYQFYATDILGLSTEDSVTTIVEKSDYGQRIHLILSAFHGNVAALPGPFPEPLDESNRAEALEFLKSLSETVFSRDIEDNIWHLGWLRLWESHMAAYIDWQRQRQDQWRVVATECMRKRDDAIPGFVLKGRLDRIDSDHEQFAIIDYKTGRTPRQADVDNGEAIQLPFYAALVNEPVSSATYLSFTNGAVQARPFLTGMSLQTLAERNRERLSVLLQQLRDQTPLPAWGDETTCSICPMAGVCRRQSWLPDQVNLGAAGSVESRKESAS